MAEIAVIAAALAAFLTALSIIWHKGCKPVWRFVTKVHAVFDRVMEYDDRLKVIEERSAQLTNNGGSHMKDAIDRTEAMLRDHLEDSKANRAAVSAEFMNVYRTIAGQPAGS